MEVTIKITLLVLATLFCLASLSANDIKRAYLEITGATIMFVLLFVSMEIF